MIRRGFDDLPIGTDRFTAGTRLRLERTVARTLSWRRTDIHAIRSAVRGATMELLAQGVDPVKIPGMLGDVVEAAGRASRADRTALMSGEPQWMAVRRRMMEVSQRELAAVGATEGMRTDLA